ncbi:MAG: site-2 protease family protein [Desulfurococcus sp.]|uniref:site-2 protease family protein n=1 Tax=Desulfurococcus sp. TaxID=51678 RepID=UPI003164545C
MKCLDILYVFIASLIAFWVVVNLFYRYFLVGRYNNIEIHGYVVLVIKRKTEGRASPSGEARLHNIFLTILYFISLALFFYMVAISLLNRLYIGSTGVVVLVPGVNVVGMDALLFIIAASIGASLHELFHARLAIRNGVPVKSFGVMLALIIPLAYVEVEEEEFRRTEVLKRLGVLSAGVAVNLILAIVSLVLLTLATSPIGVLVTDVEPGSPAYRYGIHAYDVITSINGSLVKSINDIPVVKMLAKPTSLNLTVWRRDAGYVNLVIPIGVNDERIGIYLSSSPRIELLEYLGGLPAFLLYKFLLWMYMINLSLSILNAAPLFITDGGRIINELAGNKYGNIINIIGVIILLLILLP